MQKGDLGPRERRQPGSVASWSADLRGKGQTGTSHWAPPPPPALQQTSQERQPEVHTLAGPRTPRAQDTLRASPTPSRLMDSGSHGHSHERNTQQLACQRPGPGSRRSHCGQAALPGDRAPCPSTPHGSPSRCERKPDGGGHGGAMQGEAGGMGKTRGEPQGSGLLPGHRPTAPSEPSRGPKQARGTGRHPEPLPGRLGPCR